MSNYIKEKGNEFMLLANDIAKHCSRVSCKSCENGKCIFSDKESRCIFESKGMDFPFNWTFYEENKS